ncbi:MAG: TPM domain-containing protein [Gilvibacter sp.]
MKLRKLHISVFFWLVMLFTSIPVIAQYDIPNLPDNREDQIVYDDVKLLSEYQKTSLVNKLRNYDDTTSTQIAIAIIGSTNGEDISLLGAKWGTKWGVGQEKEDNGIFILLARDDRTIDINTGYGIEYRMTDLMTERIINRVIIPEFKKGDYYAGLDEGTDAIFKALNGEFVAPEEESNFPSDWGISATVLVLMVLYIILLIVIAKKSKGGGTYYGTGPITYSGSGRSSGSYSSSSSSSSSYSSGSSSFGGGSFGGGGASGSW